MSDACEKASVIESVCIPIFLFDFVLTVLIHAGTDQSSAEQLLSELFDAAGQLEKANAELQLRLAHLFTTVIVEQPLLRIYANRFLEKAVAVCNNDARCSTLKARLLLIEGEPRHALQMAMKAVEQGASGPDAMFSVVHCHLELGNVKEAKNQFQFLVSTEADISKHSHFHFLNALLAKASGEVDNFMRHIQRCVDIHTAYFCKQFYAIEHLERLDVEFLTTVALSIFEALNEDGAISSTSDAYTELERILLVVHEHCPGLAKPAFLLAKIKFLKGELAQSEHLLRECINKNSQSAEAYLLLAQVCFCCI